MTTVGTNSKLEVWYVGRGAEDDDDFEPGSPHHSEGEQEEGEEESEEEDEQD